jgi:aminomethyltransferase
MPQQTPLHARHLALGARMVDFAGYDMPLQYSGMREEHQAVRQRAGLFDLSHMGEVWLRGRGVAAAEGLTAASISNLSEGGCRYGVMCNEAGGIVDDVIVYRDHHDECMVVINASRIPVDIAWMREHLPAGATLEDRCRETALIALQGPAAAGIMAALSPQAVQLKPFTFARCQLSGLPVLISRTGYTGEDGFEVYSEAGDAPEIWDRLMETGGPAGLIPAGLGARDTLRLEAGLRLYGQDMDDTVDPFSCGLGWTVKLESGPFVGDEALRRISASGAPRRMVGLKMGPRDIARHGQAVNAGGRQVGEVTSGTYSFTLDAPIATALIDAATAADEPLNVTIRDREAPAAVVPLPFYRRPKES